MILTRLLIPKSILNFDINKNREEAFIFLKDNFIGGNTFKVESVIGHKNISYFGDKMFDEIRLTRDKQSINKIPIYPTIKLSLNQNKNVTQIKVECSLSTEWVLFLVILYFFLAFYCVYSLRNSISNLENMLIIIKTLSVITLINILVWTYHLSEVKIIASIFRSLLNKTTN